MGRLAIRGLRKSYGKVEALKGVDLDIEDGEFCVFVGPSGCGKSTMLRTIAGLEEIDAGTVSIDGAVVNGLRPRDRDIAMVFQNYALYPYLSVYENIAFGLRARKTPDAEVRERVTRAAEMLGVSQLLDRTPRQLSGGQRQRVAIGRAVVREARLFLFDEPLSNLDAQLRDGMRAEIKRLHQEIGKTTIYVTHDQIEAMTLADRIVLMRDGRIEQQGAPLDLFERPATRFVAGFLGSPQMNFIPCRLERRGESLAVVFADGRSLAVDPCRAAALAAHEGREMILGVRPEHMSRAQPGNEPKPGEARLSVLVDLVQPTGTRTYAQFRIGEVETTVELPAHIVEHPGTTIDLLVDMSRVVLIDPETDAVISSGAANGAGNPLASTARKGAASMSPSRSVKLFGTEEPAGKLTPLKAGLLEARLDGGDLRYVKIGGVEALRGIAFLCRDKNWGTYNPEIANLQIQQSESGFTVTYDARCRDAEQSFRYSARIEGRADGGLSFEAEGEAESDFVTNRTGFVVLHALAGVVGHPVTVEHTSGEIVESAFPELVNPACPFQDVRALTHRIAPDVAVECRMEGDAFEMEDHRNWMDASYKTYVRPLALPWPYTIAKGEKTPQRVTLTVRGRPSAPAIGGQAAAAVTIGEEIGAPMPRMGLAVPAEQAAAALERAELLRSFGAGFLVCHFDPRAGHGASEMRRFAELGRALETELVLEAVVPCEDASGAPSADEAILKRDMAALREASEGVEFARVAVSPATDLKCTLPGSTFPPAPSWEALFAAAQAAFPAAKLGGGMFSYFTELNRKRPPAELLDFICHSGCPIVHAGDDISLTETLESLPSIFRTVRSFAHGKPYWVFPTAVSMRANPYGAAPAENPENIRQAMNRVDPRDRALLGAAWCAGYMAHAASAGVEAVTLAAVAGPSGVLSTPQPYARPWFDEADAVATPSFAALSLHTGLQGASILETGSDRARSVQALAVATPAGRRLILSNLTGEEQTVRISGAAGESRAWILDEESFEALCRNPTESENAAPVGRGVDLGGVKLAPYAVAAIGLD